MITVINSAQIKAWLRLDTDDEDSAIDLLICVAQEQASAYTGRALTPETCPLGIKQAIAVFVADLYANREGQTVGEKTFMRLLSPYRVTLL